MDQICDLHVHSHFSDGTVSPSQLIDIARKIGLSAVALCDHNTISGLPEFVSAAVGTGVEAVPGIEFSTDYGTTELHIIGLFIQPEHYHSITLLLKEMLDRKEQSYVSLLDSLGKVGLTMDYSSIKAGTTDGQVNRAIIAAEMVRMGYCESIKQAFSRWLSPKRGFYVEPKRLDVFETIRFIKSIGAVAVLAHPFLNLNESDLRRFLSQAKPCGLDAMEVFYPLFNEDQTRLALSIADEFDLLPSGGSDFHGDNKPDISMGNGKDNLNIPLHVLESLKKISGK